MLYSLSYGSHESIDPKLRVVPKLIHLLLGMGVEPVCINRGEELSVEEFNEHFDVLEMLFVCNRGEYSELVVPGMETKKIVLSRTPDRLRFTNYR